MFGCYTLRKSSTSQSPVVSRLTSYDLTLTLDVEYLDKTLVNYANVMGLQKDAGITGTGSKD
jgi:hypothetical protein